MWDDLFAAIALLLVFEGIMPFASPKMARRYLKALVEQSDQMLRIFGLTSMVMGTILLLVFRSSEWF